MHLRWVEAEDIVKWYNTQVVEKQRNKGAKDKSNVSAEVAFKI